MIQKQTKSLKSKKKLSVYTTVVYRLNFNSDEEYDSYINQNYGTWEKVKEFFGSEGPLYAVLIKEVYV